MVSLQSSNSPKGSKTIFDLDGSSNNKRKWIEEDESLQTHEGIFGKRLRSPAKPVFEIELQLETPLPLEWQRCLDIQSGQIHFYNTRTKKRTSMDPRRSRQEEPQTHMSLDLELNLPCDSQRQTKHKFGSSIMDFGDLMKDSSNKLENNKKKNNTSFEEQVDEEEVEEEMVAIVCERCHLLVMLCKSSPSCPNCKFMHSIDDHNFTNYQFKPTLLASCVTYL